MRETRHFLTGMGLPPSDLTDLPSSEKRFADGAEARIEIPSVEGPRALRGVIEAAREHGITVHRVSQGSGVMLLSDAEIREMAILGCENGIEVSLFVGPRGAWDISATPRTPEGAGQASRHEGMDQVVYAVEDIKRACRLGIRGVLVADEGLLWIVREMKRAGELPADLVVKGSVAMGAANPASIRLVQEHGADTYNLPTGLTLPKLAAIRAAIDIPVDLYVEVPDALGGHIRFYELPEIVRVAAPIHVKFGLVNATNVYPSGTHLEAIAVAQCREKVRRAAIALDLLRRYRPETVFSEVGAAGLGIPRVDGLVASS